MSPAHLQLDSQAAAGWLAALVFAVGSTVASTDFALGQQFTVAPPPQLAAPAERLMMEQAGELSRAGQVDEALQLLEKLLDEAEDRLVLHAVQPRAATLLTQRFVPLAEWVWDETRKILAQHPEAAQQLTQRHSGQARQALEQLQQQKSLDLAQRLMWRYGATEFGAQFQLLLCDLYLERGWSLAASAALQRLVDCLRTPLSENLPATGLLPSSGVEANSSQPELPSLSTYKSLPAAGSLSAAYAWQQLTIGAAAEERQQLWRARFAPQATDELKLACEAARRLVLAAAMSADELDLTATVSWARALVANQQTPGSAVACRELQQLLDQLPQWRGGERLDSQARRESPAPLPRTAFVDWARWSQRLEKYSASSDRVAASKPRVGETERGTLAYFPVVQDGRVYVNELTRIVAFDVLTGDAWPDPRTGQPLFDGHTSPAAYLPLGYPMVGVPRGLLSLDGDQLYARMGSPITGRLLSRPVDAAESASYLVGLDLKQQGSMLAGFPLHLKAPEFQNAEFDGPPLVWGDALIVAIAERDHVGLRRYVAAFHRVSGGLLWKSAALATGMVAGGDRANLIAQQQLTLAGGRLYYNTNLGSIVCLDPQRGAVHWLTQYTTLKDDAAFPSPRRYRYRDLTPCLVSGGLVCCAPQDTPEIFALDAFTGELVWSTDDTSVADVVHLLGVSGDTLLVSGDRLLWLDRRTGAVQASFPGSTTPLVIGALPSPRGLGRGTIASNRIFWPTAGEILVFPAEWPAAARLGDPPQLLARVPVQPGGTEGCHVMLVDRTLLVASPSRLMAFPPVSKP